MPRLAFFVPCQRYIVDQGDNTLSVIGVLEAISVQTDADGNLPPAQELQTEDGTIQAVIVNYSWATVAQWHREPEDEGRKFAQRIQIIYPDSAIHSGGLMPFQFTAEPGHRATTLGQALPIRGEGIYYFRLSVREDGETPGEWSVVSEYPLIVQFVLPPS